MGSTEVVLKTTEPIQQVQDRLRTARSRQKIYADRCRSDLEFASRPCASEGITLERCHPVSKVGQVRPQIY